MGLVNSDDEPWLVNVIAELEHLGDIICMYAQFMCIWLAKSGISIASVKQF